MKKNNPARKPMPQDSWAEEVINLRRAVVVPPTISSFVQEAGILDSEGHYCEHGALWRKSRAITVAPKMPEGEIPTLKGRWLWGSVLWLNFGHFLAESTTRLWALDHIDGPIDGILFIPKRPRAGDATAGYQQAFFDLMGIDVPIKVAAEPVRVEELIVPGQGFGIGAISAGTKSFRDTIHQRFGKDIAPDGPEKIYLSRSALGTGRGSFLGEDYLEAKLAAEGYEIFHPQQHSLAVQVARYKAAKQVVAADGSALHVFAMVGRSDQTLAVVARRHSSALGYLVRHLAHFCGRAPLVIEKLRRTWLPAGEHQPKRLALGELDLPEVGRLLVEGGFLSDATPWVNMSEDEVQAAMAARRRSFVSVTPPAETDGDEAAAKPAAKAPAKAKTASKPKS